MNGEDLFQSIFLKGRRPYFWLAVIIFAIFAQSLFFSLTFLDDNFLVSQNYSFINDMSNVLKIFQEDVFRQSSGGLFYRPLLVFSFMIDANFTDGNSLFIYHFSNIIFHIIATVLFFTLLVKLKYKKDLSFMLSLLFAAHPALVQAVAWIPGRNDSLLAIFTLTSFILFLEFLRNKKWRNFLFHFIFLAAALFTKEIAVILPVIYLIYYFLYTSFQKSEKTDLKKKLFLEKNAMLIFLAGWITVVSSWFFVRKAALGGSIGYPILEAIRSVWLNLSAVILFIGKIIFPFQLSTYPILEDASMIWGSAAVLLFVGTILLSGVKEWKKFIFGLLWFLFFLIPSFVRPDQSIVPVFLEHRMYLPAFGFFVMLAEINYVKNWEKNRKILLKIGIILTVLFAGLAFIHSGNFKDGKRYWSNAVLTSPRSSFARKQLGTIYYLNGETLKAESEYKKSLELNPREPMVHNNLGLIYMNRGLLEEAEMEYKKDLDINPYHDNANFNLGLLYYKQGKLMEAEVMWLRTIEINPNYIDAYNNLAAYYYQRKNFEKAAYYSRAGID